jgi:hypothetical protein
MAIDINEIVAILKEIDPTFESNSTFDTKEQAMDAFRLHLKSPKKVEKLKKLKK